MVTLCEGAYGSGKFSFERNGREQGLERGSSRSRTGTRGSAGQARMWAGDVSSGAGASSSLPSELNLLINSAEGLSGSSTSWSGLFVPEETSSSSFRFNNPPPLQICSVLFPTRVCSPPCSLILPLLSSPQGKQQGSNCSRAQVQSGLMRWTINSLLPKALPPSSLPPHPVVLE